MCSLNYTFNGFLLEKSEVTTLFPLSLLPSLLPFHLRCLPLSSHIFFGFQVITFYYIPTISSYVIVLSACFVSESIPFHPVSFWPQAQPCSHLLLLPHLSFPISMILWDRQALSLICVHTAANEHFLLRFIPKGQIQLFNWLAACLPASVGLKILIFSVSFLFSHLLSVCNLKILTHCM